MEILEDMEKEELKYVSAANLAGGLAYIFTDIATTGEINLLSVAAFVIALLTVLGIGYLRTRKHQLKRFQLQEQAIKPEKIREDFPIFQEREDLAYLDSAATAQKPEKVIEAVENFYSQKNSNAGSGLYDLAADATQVYENSRKKVAEFIRAEKDEVVFVRNTTEAENLLADSLEFDGEIVLSEMAYHSEQLPWRRKAEEEGKNIEYLETEDGKISLDSAREKISEEIVLVAISHTSNVFGAENPVEKISQIVHEKDALVVLDAAQSALHMPLDVEKLEVDFLRFSGHKMLGPTGIGVLYGRKNLLEDMKPYQVGGGMINKVQKDSVSYDDVPEKFEARTQNIAGAVGLVAAVEYLEDIGMEKFTGTTENSWKR